MAFLTGRRLALPGSKVLAEVSNVVTGGGGVRRRIRGEGGGGGILTMEIMCTGSSLMLVTVVPVELGE